MKRATRISRITMKPPPRPSRIPQLAIFSAAFSLATTFLVLFALLVTAGVGAYQYYQSIVPSGLQTLISYEQQPYQVSVVEDRNGNVLQDLANPSLGIRDIVPLNRIPRNLINATVDTENRTFWTDPGVDPVRLFSAGLHDLSGSGASSLQGASTLTEQLVKLAVFGSIVNTTQRRLDRANIVRRLDESMIAIGATQRFKKDGILEMYLNTVPYGAVIYGAEEAAKYYFGKDVSQLDLAQCAMLAGLPQNPTVYDPVSHLSAAIARQHEVLKAMLKQRDITQAEYQAAVAEPIGNEFVFKYPVTHTSVTGESYFVNWLVNVYLQNPKNLQQFHIPDLQQPNDIYRGFIFKTTLDPNWQSMAQNIVQTQIAGLGSLNVTDGALVAIDPHTNEIRAMVGGVGYDAPISGAQYNMAWEPRQPGSSIKPFMYVTAFEHGHFPGESIDDAYVSYPQGGAPPYVPKNYDLSYHGMVTIRTALANSYNVPAVKTFYNLVPDGSGNVTRNVTLLMKQLQEMGITPAITNPKKEGLSMTLGADPTRLLEETNGYAVFANNGIYRPYMPISAIYRKVPGGKPQLVWQYHTPEGVQVVAPQFAYEITSILSDVAAKVPAFGDAAYQYLSLPDRPVAAKTGTTNDFKDNLTMGYTPNLVTGVWVGNPNDSPMLGSTGITGAAPIWHQFMLQATQSLPVEQFIQPPGIITATVSVYAPAFGLPGLSGSGVTDIFAAGQVPHTYDVPSQDSYTGGYLPSGAPGAPGAVATGVTPGTTASVAPGTSTTGSGNPNAMGLAQCHGGPYTYTSSVVNGTVQYTITCH